MAERGSVLRAAVAAVPGNFREGAGGNGTVQ